MSKNICKNCSADMQLEWIFCPECGYQNNKVIQICPNCKQKLFVDWKFCTHCGTRLFDVNVIER